MSSSNNNNRRKTAADLARIGGFKNSSNNNSTDILASKGNRVNPANLSLLMKNINESVIQKDNLLRPPPSALEAAEATYKSCKITRIMLYEEDELDLFVRSAKNCMTEQTVLPINTPDPTDAEIGTKIFDLVIAGPSVYKRALIWHVLLLCPHFCRFMIDQGVDAEKIDAFVNNLSSDATLYQAQYTLNVIQTSALFVTDITKRWIEFRIIPKK